MINIMQKGPIMITVPKEQVWCVIFSTDTKKNIHIKKITKILHMMILNF